MLTIRQNQMRTLERSLLDSFIDSTTAYALRQWPAAGVTRDQVASMISNARALGFEDRAHLRTWVDWQYEFGPDFQKDESWAWFNDILENGLAPDIRIYRLENRLTVLRQRLSA